MGNNLCIVLCIQCGSFIFFVQFHPNSFYFLVGLLERPRQILLCEKKY